MHAAALLERLVGAPGIAVNNNAAAIYLALNELAAGFEVIVSRGELIEIGDGFRIPDIMQRSGAVLREIGTTNRTRIEDYRDAINDRTRLLLRVHPSNFRIQGFTARPELRELVALGAERGIPVYEDLGSGCVADLRAFGIEEPLVGDSLRAGVSLVSFSGDKLLGGPQAGILAGDRRLITRLRRNPMFRALRLDKLIYQALETTLRNLLLERWDQIPALRMIAQSSRRTANPRRSLRSSALRHSYRNCGRQFADRRRRDARAAAGKLADRRRMRRRRRIGAAMPIERPACHRANRRRPTDARSQNRVPIRRGRTCSSDSPSLLIARASNIASSAVRSAIRSIRMLSFTACAPSPTPPKPSSVGIPSAAVKFPSDPPPVDDSSRSTPSSLAQPRADSNSFRIPATPLHRRTIQAAFHLNRAALVERPQAVELLIQRRGVF